MAVYNNLAITSNQSRYGNSGSSTASGSGNTDPGYQGPGFPGKPAVSVLAPSGSIVGPFLTGGSAGGGSSKSSSNTKTEASSSIDPKSLAALQALIAQLSSGGTAQQKASQAQRQQEIQRNRQSAGDYSKAAAFSDASGAMQAEMARALQKLLPTIVRSAEGSGTSQNSMRALLTQDAGRQAAQSAAQLGLQAAQQYGSIGANYSNVLEALTRSEDAATKALLQALDVSKGAVKYGTSSSNSTEGTATAGSEGGAMWGNKMNAYPAFTTGQELSNSTQATQNPWASYSF